MHYLDLFSSRLEITFVRIARIPTRTGTTSLKPFVAAAGARCSVLSGDLRQGIDNRVYVTLLHITSESVPFANAV